MHSSFILAQLISNNTICGNMPKRKRPFHQLCFLTQGFIIKKSEKSTDDCCTVANCCQSPAVGGARNVLGFRVVKLAHAHAA